MKTEEKKKSIILRKKGYSYSEILEEVSVTKSTLSTWLRDITLTETQRKRLKRKRLSASFVGAQKKREIRIEKTLKIKKKAREEIKPISKRELWLIGIALYWAEGNKEKQYRPSESVIFSNSDPTMVQLFKKWLFENIPLEDDPIYELYLHKNVNIPQMTKYWCNKLNLDKDNLRVYTKETVSNRNYCNNDYKGIIRIKVRKSIDLNRKLEGWAEGIAQRCGIV